MTDFLAPDWVIAAMIAECGTVSKAFDASQATRATILFLDASSWMTASLTLEMASAVDRPGIPPKRFGGRDSFI